MGCIQIYNDIIFKLSVLYRIFTNVLFKQITHVNYNSTVQLTIVFTSVHFIFMYVNLLM